MILHDLQSQACNVDQKLEWPALYRWLTYGWAPPIPLSHLVQPTEMLTESGGRGQPWWQRNAWKLIPASNKHCLLDAGISFHAFLYCQLSCHTCCPLPPDSVNISVVFIKHSEPSPVLLTGHFIKENIHLSDKLNDSWLTRHDESCVYSWAVNM